MDLPTVEDRKSWTALLKELAIREGANSVAVHFEFEDNGVTYAGNGVELEE